MADLKCPEGRKLVASGSKSEITPFCMDETEVPREQYLRHKAEIAKSQYVLVHRDCSGLEIMMDGRKSAEELKASLANIAPDGKRVCGVEIKRGAFASKVRRIKDPQKPMAKVSFTEARIYCQANGGDLPTNKQWERAARGPSGTEDIGFRSKSWRDECFDAAMLTDVRNSPPNGYGLYDMSNNVWEWTLDRDKGHPVGSVIVGAGTSLVVLPPGSVVTNKNLQTITLQEDWVTESMIVRGGYGTLCLSLCDEKNNKAEVDPGNRIEEVGFRCVSEPK